MPGHYWRALQTAGYDRYLTVEISVMVQRRPDYEASQYQRRSSQVFWGGR